MLLPMHNDRRLTLYAAQELTDVVRKNPERREEFLTSSVPTFARSFKGNELAMSYLITCSVILGTIYAVSLRTVCSWPYNSGIRALYFDGVASGTSVSSKPY